MPSRLSILFYRWWDNTISPEELHELINLIGKEENTTALNQLLEESWDISVADDFVPDKTEQWLQQMIQEKVTGIDDPRNKKAVILFGWKRWAAAAVFVGFIILAISLFFNRNTAPENSIKNDPIVLVNDIAPGGNKAILTMSNGQRILLDSTQGIIASGDGSTIINSNGILKYNAGNAVQVIVNTVTTPKGGQYQLVLEDGTKVWLNAASSIRFPSQFTTNTRQVEITGEAYFEVAHNASKPFHVKVRDLDVQVLGTHFNINSYADEEAIKTTLLEGSVKVTSGTSAKTIRPGEQASLQQSRLSLYQDVDVDAVIAWKNGIFSFKNTDLKMIMRQVARWYDVEVTIEAGVPATTFSGKMGRDLTLKQFLNILDKARIHYRLEPSRLIIIP